MCCLALVISVAALDRRSRQIDWSWSDNVSRTSSTRSRWRGLPGPVSRPSLTPGESPRGLSSNPPARVLGPGTRETIQRRDIDKVKVASADHCKVVGGELYDKYTGKTVKMIPSNIDKYEVDHVVSLSDAWQKGAQSWSAAKRTAFANDPANLVLVSEKVNAQKGDGDAATWLPPEKDYRCYFVSQQVAVKQNYGRWVTVAEQEAMTKVLASCTDENLGTEDLFWIIVPVSFAPRGGGAGVARCRAGATGTNGPPASRHSINPAGAYRRSRWGPVDGGVGDVLLVGVSGAGPPDQSRQQVSDVATSCPD